MKTLENLKNTYAQERGYGDWNEFLNYYGGRHPEWFDQHWQEICIRAQKEALEKAAENVTTVHHANQSSDEIKSAIHYTKNSITNPENLIR